MSKLPKDAQIFLVGVSSVTAFLILLNSPRFPWDVWPELLLFLVLISFASLLPIPDPRGGFITAASVLFYVLIMVHGPWPGLFIAGPAYALGAAVSRRWIPWRMIFNGAQMALSVWLAGIAFELSGGSISRFEISSSILPLAVAILIHQAANNLFISYYFSRVRKTPFFATWIADIRGLLVSNLLSIPVAGLLAYLYVTVHPLTLLSYLISLPFQRRAHILQIKQRQIFDQAIDALVIAIDAGFPQGPGHSRRVANTATAIGRYLGLSDSQIDTLELGALLHDVGLIGLDEFLVKDESPSDQVVESLKAHVEIGAQISRDLPQKGVSEIVLYHHEHFDGSGYPKRLAGRRIPIGARVVALAEAFESMRAGGVPYGSPMPTSMAKERILSQSSTVFDPEVVRAFIAAMNAGTIGPVDSRESVSTQQVSEAGAPS